MNTRTMRSVLCLAVAMVTLQVGATEPSPAPSGPVAPDAPGTLSALDYVQIEQLVHRLQYTLDFCTDGGRGFADMFAADGRFIIEQSPNDVRVLATKEQLVKLAGGPDCQAVRTAPRSYVLHTEANLIIEPAPGGARGISYAIYPANHGHYYKDEFAGQVGLYLDEYVRTPVGWRVKSRHHMVNIQAADAPALAR